MPRLTLRTLLAYIDDTLEPDQARALGRKVAESDEARILIERIKKVTRRRGLRTPVPDGSDDDVADPNTVAAYLSDNLDAEQLKQIESTCLDSDVHLAEVAACHQILTLVMTEPVRVPPTANQRMYALVPPPGSDQNRKPGKTMPVGRVTPPVDQHEGDDPDAALLLGLKRYSAADSWSGRMILVAAAAGICVFLVLAILMALPHSPGEAPKASPSASYALAPVTPTPNPAPAPSTTTPSTPLAPPPSTPSGPSEPKTPVEPKKDIPIKDKDPGKGLGDPKVPLPNPGRGEIGKMETPTVIVLSREPDPGARWERVDPDHPRVFASNSVLALPGYKAEVKLASGIVALLWGNVPEQLPMKAAVMQSRVRFHMPPEGFDADLTIEEGRVYLSSAKAAKVRVRIASEAWDIEIPEKSRVMVQAHAAFVPGTPYPAGGKGGEPPRIDGIMVVINGTANFEAPARHAKFAGIKQWDRVQWNSKVDKLEPPAPVNKHELQPDPDTLIPSDKGEAVQRVLSESARNLKDRDGIRQHLEARMNYARTEETDFARIFATYAYAAILNGIEGEELRKMVANLYDVMNDSDRIFVRQAGVVTVSAWLAQSLQNTLTFVTMLQVDKNFPAKEANAAAHLLRGYSAATEGPAAWLPSKVDELIELLNSDYMVIREAALGNLIGYYDIPYTFSSFGPVKLVDRNYEALVRMRKVPEAIAAKLKPLLNKEKVRGEMVNDVIQLLGKADAEMYMNDILEVTTIRGPFTNVGTKGEDYPYFIKAWEERGQGIKQWLEAGPMKSPPMKK